MSFYLEMLDLMSINNQTKMMLLINLKRMVSLGTSFQMSSLLIFQLAQDTVSDHLEKIDQRMINVIIAEDK